MQKNSDVQTNLNNKENHFKSDPISVANQLAKINRAKEFYNNTIAGKVKIETTNNDGTPDWNKVFLAYIQSKGEAVVIPIDFGGRVEYKYISTGETADAEKTTKIWMYEISPGVFTIDEVTNYTFNGKEYYIIDNLINNTEKAAVEINGIAYKANTERHNETGVSSGTGVITMVHCDIIGTFLNTYNSQGVLINSILISSRTVCEITGVFYSDENGGTVGFDPKDDNIETDVKALNYAWEVDNSVFYYNLNSSVHWTVKSWENFFATLNTDKTKSRFTNATHTRSGVGDYSSNAVLSWVPHTEYHNMLSTTETEAYCFGTLTRDLSALGGGAEVFNPQNSCTFHLQTIFPQ